MLGVGGERVGKGWEKGCAAVLSRKCWDVRNIFTADKGTVEVPGYDTMGEEKSVQVVK